MATDAEKLFVQQWTGLEKTPFPTVKDARTMLRGAAVHEAGHTAAFMFFGAALTGEIDYVTVIPCDSGIGHCCGRSDDPDICEHRIYPLMVTQIMGNMAVFKWCQDLHSETRRRAEEWVRASPEAEFDLAEMAATPRRPYEHRLNYAHRWTGELLDYPPVWRTVLHLADLLYAQGKLDTSQIHAACSDIHNRAYAMGKWRRRISWLELNSVMDTERGVVYITDQQVNGPRKIPLRMR